MGRGMEWLGSILVLGTIVATTSADLTDLCVAPSGPRLQELCDLIFLTTANAGGHMMNFLFLYMNIFMTYLTSVHALQLVSAM